MMRIGGKCSYKRDTSNSYTYITWMHIRGKCSYKRDTSNSYTYILHGCISEGNAHIRDIVMRTHIWHGCISERNIHIREILVIRADVLQGYISEGNVYKKGNAHKKDEYQREMGRRWMPIRGKCL